MTTKIDIRNQAMELRKKGMSYKEILELLSVPIAKSTLSKWFSKMHLTTAEKKVLEVRFSVGREKSRYNATLAHNL